MSVQFGALELRFERAWVIRSLRMGEGSVLPLHAGVDAFFPFGGRLFQSVFVSFAALRLRCLPVSGRFLGDLSSF